MKKSKRFQIMLLSVMVLSLLFVGSVQVAKADIKVVNPFYAWDQTKQWFVNSMAALVLDETEQIPVPFIHQLSKDTDLVVDACGPGTQTDWAGTLALGLGHIDTTGQDGFQRSQNWTLVYCDRNEDGKFDNSDLRNADPNAAYYGFTQWAGISSGGDDAFVADPIDDVLDCSNSTCAKEIVTTLTVNLDFVDCDGQIDYLPPELEAGGICFYAEGIPPLMPTNPADFWQGNLQARISDGGGDKTVNFTVEGPTAVTMVDFLGQSMDARWMLLVTGLVLLGVTIALVMVRKQKASKDVQ
jgi:hypothetical protein